MTERPEEDSGSASWRRCTPSWGEVSWKAGCSRSKTPGQGRRQEQNCGVLGAGINGVTGTVVVVGEVYRQSAIYSLPFPSGPGPDLFNPPWVERETALPVCAVFLECKIEAYG